MAAEEDGAHVQFKFKVVLGDIQVGFQECSIVGMGVAEKTTDITLKRGVMGKLDLYRWLQEIRNGDETAFRTVLIHMKSDDHGHAVLTWKLHRARILKHVSGPLDAEGTDVAMEELTLAYERLDME
jgi:phage tail-like protein